MNGYSPSLWTYRLISWSGIATFFLGAVLSSGVSYGGILAGLSGNHRAVAESDGQLDASLSFAVFELGGSSGDAYGTGLANFDALFHPGDGSSSLLDTSAGYLYLYQYVNDGSGTAGVSSVTIEDVTITSWGHWARGMQDTDGNVDVNNPLGLNGASFQQAAPANVGVSSGGVSNEIGHLDQEPRRVTYVSDNFSAAWQLFSNDEVRLYSGNASSLFGFTSNSAPVVRSVSNEGCADDYACGGFVAPPLTRDQGTAAGDYDGSGFVAGLDFLTWQREFGQIAPTLMADGNGDGRVGGEDLEIWEGNYGLMVSQLGYNTIVAPEPSASAAIQIALVILMAYRSRVPSN